MSEQEYDELWHYSEQFTRDKFQRSELVTMAWKEGQGLGDRCTPSLMKSMMHFRAKELNRRSAFPAKEVVKRTLDAWNHDRVYIDRPVETKSLGEFLLPMKITPLDNAITNDFLSSLNDNEMDILNDLSAGYNMKEISKRNDLQQSHFTSLRQSLQEKAVAYLWQLESAKSLRSFLSDGSLLFLRSLKASQKKTWQEKDAGGTLLKSYAKKRTQNELLVNDQIDFFKARHILFQLTKLCWMISRFILNGL